jgi:phosphomannomutase/phosphoglucomutase
VVTRDGEIIYPDRQLMLFAADVLSRNPGAQIIYDVKCTRCSHRGSANTAASR